MTLIASRTRPRTWVVLGALAAIAVATASLGASASSPASAASCGTVTLNENSWIGSTANVYVVKNVLESKLGCKVNITRIAVIPVYRALEAGTVDAVLEDWQHVDQYELYEQKLKVAQDAGSNGVVGHIGWFVPTYVVTQHPELKTWKGLTQDWALFKTVASGDQGQLLDGDPTYPTADKSLINNLHLNLKVVYAGGEASQITQVKQAYAQKKPILFYWYTPQWLSAQLKLSEVLLPSRTPGCDAIPAETDCAYPSYDLRKVISTKFAKSGSPAVNVIKRFSWTAQDQNAVAVMIAAKKMSPDAAAKKWIAANPSKVKAWLG